MVRRIQYLNNIRPFINKPLIKAIIGIRRSGKSTLLNQIIEELKESGIKSEQIIFINKELFEFDSIKTYGDLHSYVTKKTTKKSITHYLFVDEIQEIEQWEKAINSLLTEKKYDIYITGSNARLLSSELATLLSGRYIEIPVFTLTFKEFSVLYSEKQHGKENVFNQFIKYGGFPGLHSMEWNEIVLYQYLQAIYNSIVLKDIVARYNLRDVSMLSHILNFLADNCGNITSAKSISDFVKSQNRKISSDTVQNYINFTLNALLIQQIRRYDINGKRILETHEKYFISDLGLRYAMIGYTPSMISGILENVVLLEMLTRGYKMTIGKNQQKEIDFIAQKGNEKLYIQVCSTLNDSKVVDREYGAFTGINDHFPKIVLSLDNGFEANKNGIKWFNIPEFLLSK
jgi:predicted AAA+ superfamily ATPase